MYVRMSSLSTHTAEDIYPLGVEWPSPMEMLSFVETYAWLPMVTVTINPEVIMFQWLDEQATTAVNHYFYRNNHWTCKREPVPPFTFQCSSPLMIHHFSSYKDRSVVWKHFDSKSKSVHVHELNGSEVEIEQITTHNWSIPNSKLSSQQPILTVEMNRDTTVWDHVIRVHSARMWYQMVMHLTTMQSYFQSRIVRVPTSAGSMITCWLIQTVPPWPEVQYCIPISDTTSTSSNNNDSNSNNNNASNRILQALQMARQKMVMPCHSRTFPPVGAKVKSIFSQIYGKTLPCRGGIVSLLSRSTTVHENANTANTNTNNVHITKSKSKSKTTHHRYWLNTQKGSSANGRCKKKTSLTALSSHSSKGPLKDPPNSKPSWLSILSHRRDPDKSSTSTTSNHTSNTSNTSNTFNSSCGTRETLNAPISVDTEGYERVCPVRLEWLSPATWNRHNFNLDDDVLGILNCAKPAQLQQILLAENVCLPLQFPKATTADTTISYTPRGVSRDHLLRIFQSRYEAWHKRQSVTQTQLHMHEEFCKQRGPRLPIHPISSADFKSLQSSRIPAPDSQEYAWDEMAKLHSLSERYPYLASDCKYSEKQRTVCVIAQLMEWREIYVVPIDMNSKKSIILMRRILILPEHKISSVDLARMVYATSQYYMVQDPENSKLYHLAIDTDELFYVYESMALPSDKKNNNKDNNPFGKNKITPPATSVANAASVTNATTSAAASYSDEGSSFHDRGSSPTKKAKPLKQTNGGTSVREEDSSLQTKHTSEVREKSRDSSVISNSSTEYVPKPSKRLRKSAIRAS